MPNEPDNIVLEYLRRIDAKLDRVITDVRATHKYHIAINLSEEEARFLIERHWQMIEQAEKDAAHAEVAWRKLRIRVLHEAMQWSANP